MSNVAVLGFTAGDAFFGNGGGNALFIVEALPDPLVLVVPAPFPMRGGGSAVLLTVPEGGTGGENSSSSRGGGTSSIIPSYMSWSDICDTSTSDTVCITALGVTLLPILAALSGEVPIVTIGRCSAHSFIF